MTIIERKIDICDCEDCLKERVAELTASNKRLQGFYDDVEVDNLRKSEHIVALKETTYRQSIIIFAKEYEIAELTRMLFAIGKQDGQTIRALAEENRGLRLQLHMEAK